MSASIAGTTFFSSNSSSPRRPTLGSTNSAPALTNPPSSSSHPPNAPTPMNTHNHPYPQMATHLASSTVVQPLQPLTPISSPLSPPQSQSGQLYSNQSVISFASTSSASSSLHRESSVTGGGGGGGVSRASSCRSTNSVQAVPIKKPTRGPVVPRIVTRGLSAIAGAAYGLGSPTTTTTGGGGGGGPSSKIYPPNSPRPLPTEDQDDDDSRPPLRHVAHSYGSACSPVEESSSNNEGDGSSDNQLPMMNRGRRVRGTSGNSWNTTTTAMGDSNRTRTRERVESLNSNNSHIQPGTSSSRERLTTTTTSTSPRLRETSSTSTRTTTTNSSNNGGGGGGPPNSMGVIGNRRSVEDFKFHQVLGEGSYSTVTLVQTLHPPYRKYALKVLDKEHIKREKKTKYVLIERDTLKKLDGHPGIVRLYWTFQDEFSLYYVLELAPNGELLKWIKQYGSFDLRSARYYLAQILSAVEFMHEKGVIHRDLKPENVLFGEDMRIKVTDFGTAKLLTKPEELIDGRPSSSSRQEKEEEETKTEPRTSSSNNSKRARSFVGTPEYVSPEVLSEGRESSFSSDFWAIGCILFQMLSGKPPFQARTEYLMFQKIINLEYEFPLGFPKEAKDLVEKLLVVDPLKRLGGDPKKGNGIQSIKEHPFFTSQLKNSDGLFPSIVNETTTADELPESAFEEDEEDESDDYYGGGGGEERKEEIMEKINSKLQQTRLEPRLQPPPSLETESAPPSIPSQSPLTTANTRHRVSSPPRQDVLDLPIDFETIWTIQPPEIRTGLVQPVPVQKGEFVLDLEGFDQGGGGDQGEEDTWDGEGQASVSDEEEEEEEDQEEDDEICSSPTESTSAAQDLPTTRGNFNNNKWSNVLLPSETILLTSRILQRPSSASQAKTALLRSSKIKFPSKVTSSLNPLNLITSASTVSTPSTATGHQPPVGGGNGLVPPTIASTPLPPGTKERTLILTDYPRLLCLKQRDNGKISVKSQVFLGSALRGGVRKEGVSAFIAVEGLGSEGKGFVVKTSQRNHKYYEPSGQAARWVQELREAHSAGLQSQQPRR
ncbi:hypothetical protein JCM5350_001127 [Sporobolomyces pararoseus]